MKNKLLYYTPRTLAILITIFISLLALDVFAEGYSFINTIIALFMHLIPTYFLIAITVFAWKKPKPGGIFFIALGLLYILLSWKNFPSLTLLIISGPLFLTGTLFLLNKK